MNYTNKSWLRTAKILDCFI